VVQVTVEEERAITLETLAISALQPKIAVTNAAKHTTTAASEIVTAVEHATAPLPSVSKHAVEVGHSTQLSWNGKPWPFSSTTAQDAVKYYAINTVHSYDLSRTPN
jgi:hypothetical protein